MTNVFIIWRIVLCEIIKQQLCSKRCSRGMMLLLSKHPYLPLSFPLSYSHMNWDMKTIATHPEMTRSFYKQLFNTNVYHKHSLKKDITVHFQRPRHFNIVIWEQKKYTHLSSLSYDSRLSLSLVLSRPHLKWDYKFLLLYHKWSIPQIHSLMTLRKMNWLFYSRNPFLSIDTLHHFLNYPWDWVTLAQSPCFPPHIIYQDNLLIGKWKWRSVFKNPRLDPSFWKQHILHKVNHDESILLHNHFQYTPTLRRWAMFHIQTAYLNHLSRKRIFDKIKLLKYIYSHLHPDTFQHIISYLSVLPNPPIRSVVSNESTT